MIGIDLTKISRFDRIDLDRLGNKLGHKLDSSLLAAKTWACLEAITKAEQHKISPKNLKLVFSTGNNIDSLKIEGIINYEEK
jgi:phosphopantetheinyl transferase (holo-ACP synthase)